MRSSGVCLDTGKIITAARQGVERIFRHGYGYAKVMVMLTDLSDPAKGQHDLRQIINDTREPDQKRKELMELVDRINRTQGQGTVRFASQGAPDAAWHMKRDRLSPAWTTDVANLLRVSGISGEYKKFLSEN